MVRDFCLKDPGLINDNVIVLKYFPQELWSTLDPKRKASEWKTLEQHMPKAPASTLAGSSTAGTGGIKIYETDREEDEDEEGVRAAGRKKRRKLQRDDPTNQGQKKGLEAEDDEQAENVDTDFSESEDGAGDDYDAEQYFETGENDDMDDGGGDNDDGVF